MSFLFPKYKGATRMPTQVLTDADLFLDCKELLCPVPIIKLSQAIKLIDIGQIILTEATDPGSKHDVAAWARQTGNELLSSEQDGRVFRFLIRRNR
jgi:tRNA 2-thiouridine synthesizing protein A